MGGSIELASARSWADAERELGLEPGGPVNIGRLCSDRICELGRASATALIWEDHQGRERRYSYDDLRLLSNALGGFLRAQGVSHGERVCLFLDRVPELYVAFLGVLKLGAIVQPLFSAFGEESLGAFRRIAVAPDGHLWFLSADGSVVEVDRASGPTGRVLVPDQRVVAIAGDGTATPVTLTVDGAIVLDEVMPAR